MLALLAIVGQVRPALGEDRAQALQLGMPLVVTPSPEGRVPGEFEHQDALMLGMNELFEFHRPTLVAILRAIEGQIQVIGLVSNDVQRAEVEKFLRENGLDMSRIEFFVWPTKMMWVQDFGPFFRINGKPTVVDFNYDHPNCDFENLLPAAIASRFGFGIDHSGLSFDGGNLLTNGAGLCISTTAIVRNNDERQFGLADIGQRLKDHFRFDQWCYLTPLVGEPTGHVDTFATFVSRDVVVVGRYDPGEDPINAEILDKNAATLATIETPAGLLRVERVLRPPNLDARWRSYSNVIYANGVVLVPQYPDVAGERDALALELYRRLLPDKKIVGIDASTLIAKRGALHCVSLNIPVVPNRAP